MSDKLKEFLKDYHYGNEPKTADKLSYLIRIAIVHEFDIVKELLKYEEKLTDKQNFEKDKKDFSIIVAANDGDLSTLQTLVETEGGEPCSVDNAAFNRAFVNNHYDVMLYLSGKCYLNKHNIKNKIKKASKNGNERVLNLLLAITFQYLDLNVTDVDDLNQAIDEANGNAGIVALIMSYKQRIITPVTTIHPETFLKFCKENQAKIETSGNKHPIHTENFDEWIKNHKEGTRARRVAERFREATRHVSLTEFFRKYDQICENIKKFLATNKAYEKIVFYTGNDLKKSNFWLTVYMFPKLDETFKSMEETVYIVGEDKLLDELFTPTGGKKTLFILLDDASYSGKQIVEHLNKAPDNINVDFFVAVGYMSNEARQKIKESKSYSIVFFPDNVEYFNLFTEAEKMRVKSNMGGPAYTIYFDHKLADSVSIYHFQYAIGFGFGTKDEFVYVPMSLIQNCETHKKIQDYVRFSPYKFTDISDLSFELEEGEMCPNPPYKSILYTFDGKVVKKLKKLNK